MAAQRRKLSLTCTFPSSTTEDSFDYDVEVAASALSNLGIPIREISRSEDGKKVEWESPTSEAGEKGWEWKTAEKALKDMKYGDWIEGYKVECTKENCEECAIGIKH
ncbi:MAG: hypothetical protein M1834_001191 [Cirrosporium novae-zelandiae]|nr:MAG: hypothetical protein M1834_001191 [Cirrosporium novae-zelandiae]